MKISYMGQQSWLFEEENTRILLDPVLTSSFGTSQKARFSIYPPRSSIDTSRLGEISAVIITNDHLDHFHLTSLKMLAKDTMILLGKHTPLFVVESLKRHGYKIVLCPHGKTIEVGTLKIIFFAGSSATPVWERRVYHPLIISSSDPKVRILIQSDTMINPMFLDVVQSSPELSPTYFIATNNAQIPYPNATGAMRNLYEYNQTDDGKMLNILDEVLCTYLYKLPDVEHIFLSGGAYILDDEKSIPFRFTIDKEMAFLASSLSLGRKVHSISPGTVYDTINQSETMGNWTSINVKDYQKYESRRPYLDNKDDSVPELEAPLMGNYDSTKSWEEDIGLIEKEHILLARLIASSEFGRTLLALNSFLEGDLGPGRFVLIYHGPVKKSYHLNMNKIIFEETAINDDVVIKYPFGMELFARDFAAVLRGEIQIWELATTRSRQWYLGDKSESPMAYFYRFFSEQIRPDLAKAATLHHENV